MLGELTTSVMTAKRKEKEIVVRVFKNKTHFHEHRYVGFLTTINHSENKKYTVFEDEPAIN